VDSVLCDFFGVKKNIQQKFNILLDIDYLYRFRDTTYYTNLTKAFIYMACNGVC
jgi:hypothetical protein